MKSVQRHCNQRIIFLETWLGLSISDEAAIRYVSRYRVHDTRHDTILSDWVGAVAQVNWGAWEIVLIHIITCNNLF